MHSPHRRSTLLAAARGAAAKSATGADSAARNLLNAAGDLPPEDAIRFNAVLRRTERLARELHELSGDIAALIPQAAGRDAA